MKMGAKQTLYLLLTTAAGALLFWLPSILGHAIGRDAFPSGITDTLLVFIAPFLLLMALSILINRKVNNNVSAVLLPICMVLGIWIAGPLAIMVSSSFSGSTAFELDFTVALILTAVFPLSTFIMSTYDGTLGPLIFITAYLMFRSLRHVYLYMKT